MEQQRRPVLVVTSAAGGEGKSVTALNLSLALSASLKGRVLLVDSDLRRPQVHQYLGLRRARLSAICWRNSGGDIRPYISKVGNLDVIVGGAPPANPLGLLASPQAGNFWRASGRNTSSSCSTVRLSCQLPTATSWPGWPTES